MTADYRELRRLTPVERVRRAVEAAIEANEGLLRVLPRHVEIVIDFRPGEDEAYVRVQSPKAKV